jgi:hypothetical protein
MTDLKGNLEKDQDIQESDFGLGYVTFSPDSPQTV